MTPETPAVKGPHSKASVAEPDRRISGIGSTPRPARRITRMAAFALLIALASTLTACGSLEPRSFSGGGVPIGGSRLFGRVVSAKDPGTSLANVTVHVQATPAGGTASDFQASTGQDGSFSFSNVLPGFSNGAVEVTATPSDAAFQSQQVTFTVANGHTEQMIVTLPPASFDLTTAKSITLSIPSPAVPTGGSVQFQAVVRDALGKPLPVMPTLVFDGNFGALNSDGSFSVPQGILSGTGTVSAYWYNLTPQTQQIHVDKNASPQPPNPPVLPSGQDTHHGG